MPSNSRKNKKTVVSRRASSLWPVAGLNRTIVLGIIVLASTLGVWYAASSHASSAELRSGVGTSAGTAGSYCLDDNGDGGTGTKVDVYKCNGTAAQHYSYGSDGLLHIGAGCARVNGTSAGSLLGTSMVVIGACSSPAPWGALWTKSGGQFHNNHADGSGTTYCLDVQSNAAANGTPTMIYPCKPVASNFNERWFPDTYTAPSSGGSSGSGISSIVNIAEQFAGKEHESPDGCNCGGAVIDGANIDTFTQHTPGEPWCADFASWVFWKAGYGLASKGSYVKTAGVTNISAWFQAHGHWYANTAANRNNAATRPQPGDWLAFDVPAANDTHGGIVKSDNGSTVTDIEGNYANGVYNVGYTISSGLNDHGNDAVGWGRF